MLRYLTTILFLCWATLAPAQQVLGGNNLNGKAPAASIGNESQWYIDWASGNIWGPKTLGQWGANPSTNLANALNVVVAHAANTSALKLLVAPNNSVVVRDGSFTPGDGGQASYTLSSTPCATYVIDGSGTTQLGDDGAQVAAASGGCWTLTSQFQSDIRIWPVVNNNGTSGDAGPPIRNALLWSTANGTKIVLPGNAFYTINSLDPTGLGALIAGPAPSTTTTTTQNIGDTSITVASATGIVTGMEIGVLATDGSLQEKKVDTYTPGNLTIPLTSGLTQPVATGANVWLHSQTANAPSWALEGAQALGSVANLCGISIPRINLGAGLNRPLIFDHPDTSSPILTNLCLTGQRTAQTGWSGGPGGKLYVIQMNDSATGNIENSMVFHNVAIEFGYNGGVYQGFGRGHVNAYDLSILYWGQPGSVDHGYYFAAYDSFFSNPEFGSSAGVTGNPVLGAAMFVKSGVQLQIVGGAFFGAYHGIEIAGGQVASMSVTGTEMNGNICGAIYEDNTGNGGTVRVAGHVFTGVQMDSNSGLGNGTCPDVQGGQGSWLTLVAPIFGGGATGINQPNYNIATGSATVNVVNPTFGTTGGGSATVAWTDNAANINCANCLAANGTPLTQLQGNSGLIQSSTQFKGLSGFNGTNTTWILQGSSSTNDAGSLSLLSGGVKKVALNSNGGPSYISGGAITLGATTTCPAGTQLCFGTGNVQLNNYTVAQLYACTSANAGAIAYVTDATSPTYNGTLTGGGTVKTLGLCNGTTWVAH